MSKRKTILAFKAIGLFIWLGCCYTAHGIGAGRLGDRSVPGKPGGKSDSAQLAAILDVADRKIERQEWDSAKAILFLAKMSEKATGYPELYIRSCNQLGSIYYYLLAFDSSLIYLDSAAHYADRHLPADHKAIALNHNHRGNTLQALNRYGEAGNYYRKSLNIRLRIFGLENKFTSASYAALGSLHYRQRNSDSAEYYLQTALTIMKAVLLPGHLQFSTLYNNLGLVDKSRGRYKESYAHFENALLIAHRHFGDWHPESARIYFNMATTATRMAHYDQALELFDKAIRIRSDFFGADHSSVAEVYVNQAILYETIGDFAQAYTCYQYALPPFLKQYGPDHYYIAIVYNNLGLNLESRGAYERALEYYQRSMKIYQKIFDKPHPNMAICYDNIGKLYALQRNWEQAFKYYWSALEIILETQGPDHPNTALTYFSLADVFLDSGDYQQALVYYHRSMDIEKKTTGMDHPKIALTFRKLGELYFARNMPDSGHFFLDSALAINQRFFGPVHLEAGIIHRLRGDHYAAANLSDSALACYRRSWQAMVSPPNGKDPSMDNILFKYQVHQTLLGQAAVWLQKYQSDRSNKGFLEEALQTYRTDLQLLTAINKSYQRERTKLTLGEEIRKVSGYAIGTALELFALTGDRRYHWESLQMAEQSKANSLLGMIHDLEARQYAGIPDSILEAEREIHIRLAHYETQLAERMTSAKGSDMDFPDELNNKVIDLRWQRDTVIRRLEKEHPDYHTLKYADREMDWTKLQKQLLESQTVIIEYFHTEKELYAFVLDQQDLSVLRIPIRIPLEEKVRQLDRSIKKYSVKNFMTASYALYRQLIEPIAAQTGQKEHWIIIPDGPLNYVPFEALCKPGLPETAQHDISAQRYLIRDHRVSYHYSMALLEKTQSKKKADKASFIGFAPVFEQPDVTTDERPVFQPNDTLAMNDLTLRSINASLLSSLPYSREEVETIAGLFRAADLESYTYIHEKANEETFKKMAGQYSYVHLATHGIINESQPKLSSLIFYPANTTAPEDGALFTAEAYNLNLDAELVVLSSCESGIGQLINGEGMMSVSRGFLYAGARNVIYSLWPVTDRYTSRLMSDCYRYILEGNSCSAALRQAKLNMIDHAETAFPQKWAGLVLLGR